jgi:flagellar biosynthesis/type III secretory pathway M-ring protein FliF/YscJ
VKGLQNHSINDVFRVYVFASNQKGRSQGIFITEFSFGNYDIQLNDSMTQTKHSSPLFVGLIFVLFLIMGTTIILRRYRKSAKKRRRRELEKADKYNQESRCSLLKQDTFAVSVKTSSSLIYSIREGAR